MTFLERVKNFTLIATFAVIADVSAKIPVVKYELGAMFTGDRSFQPSNVTQAGFLGYYYNPFGGGKDKVEFTIKGRGLLSSYECLYAKLDRNRNYVTYNDKLVKNDTKCILLLTSVTKKNNNTRIDRDFVDSKDSHMKQMPASKVRGAVGHGQGMNGMWSTDNFFRYTYNFSGVGSIMPMLKDNRKSISITMEGIEIKLDSSDIEGVLYCNLNDLRLFLKTNAKKGRTCTSAEGEVSLLIKSGNTYEWITYSHMRPCTPMIIDGKQTFNGGYVQNKTCIPLTEYLKYISFKKVKKTILGKAVTKRIGEIHDNYNVIGIIKTNAAKRFVAKQFKQYGVNSD